MKGRAGWSGICILAGLLASCLKPGGSVALADPGWWAARHVLDTNEIANDFAPLLEGQARWLLTNAACELESRLPGGAGQAVWTQVQTPGTNGFNAVNIGQLKQLAAGLYTRLMEEGVVSGWPWSDGVAGDYVPATVGQAKHLFSFEVAGVGFMPSINGSVGYSGLQTGRVHVVAIPVSGMNFPVETLLGTTGAYHVVVGHASTPWKVEAWRDSNANDVRETWEAQGEQFEPPMVVTSVVRDINVILFDPDEDGDGIPGYLERLLGLDPYYADDAFADADGDGLSVSEEVGLGSDPAAGDSDGDGMGDGAEVLNGLSPTNGHMFSSLPFLETFETPLAAGGLSGQHGWSGGAEARVIPVSCPGMKGAQCLSLAGSTHGAVVVNHPLAAYRVGRLWIDFLTVPVWRQAVIAEPPAASTVASFHFNRAGRLVIFDRTWPPGQWSVITNDLDWVTGGVARVTVQLDYSRRRWGLWLNGSPLVRGMPFSGTATELARVRFSGASYADTLLDEIDVTTNAPPDLTPDSDEDGLPDEWELAQGLDPYDPQDASADPDYDGLANRAEYEWGANPRDADTDHDGWSDGVEAAAGQSVTNTHSADVATVPFMEPFEAPVVMPGSLHGQHGWVAEPPARAVVQAGKSAEGLQALQLLPSTNTVRLRLPVRGIINRDTWSDWRAIPVRRNQAGFPAVSPDASAVFFINSGGWPVARDGTDWLTLTNIVQVPSTNWVRFTVHQDFSNQVWALYWNGYPAATGLRMAHPLHQYTGLRVSGAVNSSAWLDDLRVTACAPNEIDTDGDGLPNDWELKYGLDPADPADGADTADADCDGLGNADEFQLGLNPASPDTDQDGMGDGVERMRGFPAGDPGSFNRLPFHEPFESPDARTGPLADQHGWEVNPPEGPARVQNSTVQEGLQALQWGGTTSPVAIYQPLAAHACPVVWTDFRAVVRTRSEGTNPVLAEASTAGFFVDGSGYPVVCDGAGWHALTNQAVVPAPAWNRFTLCQNYTGRTWAFYLNGMRMATNLSLAHSAPEYSGFRATGPAHADGFLDTLTVSTNAPSGMDTASCGTQEDPDGDGLDNLAEFRSGTDPLDPDSDGDGLGDGMEIEAGYSPVSADRFAPLPFVANFETPAVTPGMLNGQDGWDTGAGQGVEVQDQVMWEGRQALALALTNRASHVVAAAGVPVIWCDFQARLVPRLLPDPPAVRASSASAFFLDKDNRLVVCSGAGRDRRWEPAAGGVSGATSRWVRITACLDYASRRWSLWCDGVRVAQDLEFANPVPEVSRWCAAAPLFSTGHVDHLSISTNEPPGLDTDGDGMPDAWERAQGFDPADSSDASADPDGDGLVNRDERITGTDPLAPDTDGDGLIDGPDGVLAIGLFPQGVDRNGDGFADGEQDHGGDPLDPDTDGDGLNDGAEAAAGLDPGASTLEYGLAAWFKLDDTGGTSVADSSPTAIDGLWCGPAPLSATPGRMGTALSFDGLTNGILIPRAGAWEACSNFSLSIWVLPQAETTNRLQVAAIREGQGGLLLNQRRPEFRIFAQGPVLLAGPEAVPAGAWSHLCLVCKEGQASLFVDGVKVAATNGLTMSASRSPVWSIGSDSGVAGGWFCGKLDDVRLYNRELTAPEVAELMALGSDVDADTQGANDALLAAAGRGPVLRAGDLDGDGLITAADRTRLGLLVESMTSRVTRLSYDAEGNLIAQINALGATASMTYDPANRLVSSTDARGNVTRQERNAAGAVVTTTDPAGHASHFTYDPYGAMTRVIDANGNTTTIDHDPLGRVIRTVSPDGAVQLTAYDALGRVECLTSGAGTPEEQAVWSFYDPSDNLVSNRNALGVVNEFRYDPRGLEVERILARGTPVEAVTATTRDARGLPVAVTNALGAVTVTRYDALGRVVATVDPLGHATCREYDTLGRVTVVTDPVGHAVRHEYDRWGREIRTWDAGDCTVAVYDAADRVIERIDRRGVRSVASYDVQGNRIRGVEAYGTAEQSATVIDYDAANRPVRVVNANGQAVVTGYDGVGNRVCVTDELGRLTRWFFRADRQVSGLIRPDGMVVSNLYDSLGRVTSVLVNGTVQQRYEYDRLSRLVRAEDYNQSGAGDDHEVVYEYDELNRVTAERQDGRRLERRYDAGNHAVQVDYPSGIRILRTYDAAGRLTALASGGIVHAAYSYGPDARIRDITYGSGVVETRGYDARGHLCRMEQRNANCEFTSVLARDPNGNVTQCASGDGEGSVFVYDALNRVTDQKSAVADLTEALRYDPLGNWVSHSNAARGAVDRTVNAANQYIRVGPALLEYDANGSLTNWNGCFYRYDFLSRLVEVASNGMTLARYAYDACNRRVSREGAGGPAAWVYDGDTLVEEYIAGGRGNTLLYADTPDTPVVLWRGGATYYYLRDWRANIMALTDAAGRPVETYRYSLFGAMEVRDGDGIPVPGSRLGNVWTYAGRQLDPETGLLHCRNRVYSPELGRFLQRDPAGYVDGLNLYAYAGNNPLMFTDPYGLYRWSHGTLDPRVGEWLFQQYGQLREIERQRREYEEALRRAEEERQRIQRENEYAARALRDYKAAHPNEVRDMVGRYKHLGVNEDEATRMLMSGITSIPRLGATVGPNDLRRDWWLDYYLRGGQVNKTMRDEMTIMGARSVDEYFIRTSEKETRLHDKRKAKQQQYSMAAVAIVATVVTCGAGGAVGAALLGTVGVTASTVSFGAFVAGAVAIQGVATAATTAISHGNAGDFAQSWAINSAAGVAGYGAGFGVARAGLDLNMQLAAQSAASTFVAEGGNTAVEGGGFKPVFRDTAISFAVGGIMGTYMAPSGGTKTPAEFGEYVARESLSGLGVLQAPLSGGLRGALQASLYGGSMGEAFLEHSVSREALEQFAVASAAAPVAGLISDELVSALPGSPAGAQPEPAYRSPPVAAEQAASVVPSTDAPRQGWGAKLARGSAQTVAEHVYEMTVVPARAISAMLATATSSTWRERSRLVNPFSRSFAGYQLLDGLTDVAQVAAGLPVSFLSGDFMEPQPAGGMQYSGGLGLVSFNGINNDAASAAAMKAAVARQFDEDELVQVSNGTHGFVLGDLVQILGNELGAVDITAIRGAQALRLAGNRQGTIQVVAHSQGTMTFRRALDLVDDPVLRQRIAYHGAGPEMFIDPRALGLASAENFWNRDQDRLLGGDPVPLANLLPSPGRWLTAPFGPVGQRGWQVVDSPGNGGDTRGNGHEFNRYYSGYIHGE